MNNKYAILLVVLMISSSLALPPCTCKRNLAPVCGSDGMTYANICVLECERDKKMSPLTVAKQGVCDGDKRNPVPKLPEAN